MPLEGVQNIMNVTKDGLTGRILDQYTPIIGGDSFDLYRGLPRWLPAHFRRRIKAYQALNALYSNVDLPLKDQEGMHPVRHGTPAYAIQVMRDLTVGGNQTIVVKGAAAEDAVTPLVVQQVAFNQWALRNLFFPKLQKAEEQTAYLGDVFYKIWVGLTRGKPDVKIEVIDPAFVFPEFGRDGQIVQVTLIWEEYRALNGIDVLMIYKDIYQYGSDGLVYETAGWYQYAAVPDLYDLHIQEYDVTDDGRVIQQLCLNIRDIPIYHFPNFWTHFFYGESDFCYNVQSAQEMNACDTDLAAGARISGLPPLVVAGFKQRIAKLFGRNNTGNQVSTDAETIGPGKIINVDSNGGHASYLDNSKMLDCLKSYVEWVEDKFFRNMRLGKLFAGKTDNIRDIESSKAFKTLMATLYSRIAQKRTVRDACYRNLLYGIVQMMRLIAGQTLDPVSAWPENDVSLEFGSILPLDNTDDLAAVTAIWSGGKGYVSIETAVRMGMKAGTGVVDIQKEAAAVLEQLAIVNKSQPSSPGQGESKPTPFKMKTPAQKETK